MNRLTALNMLCDITQNNTYLNLSAKNHLQNLNEQDKKFVYSLCANTIENLDEIDKLIAKFTDSKLNYKIKNILRLSVCQIFLMNVPVHTAVNEGVELCKKCGKAALSGFVNGILRNIGRERDNLCIKSSNPQWLNSLLFEQWSPEEANKFFEYSWNNKETTIRVNTLKTDLETMRNHFNAKLIGQHMLGVNDIGDIANDEYFKNGYYTPMGNSSALAVLCVYSGEKNVLDLCCAPGGKSAYIAALSQNRAKITATDIHEHRIELTRQNFERLGVENAKVFLFDAAGVINPNFINKFELVIVDAPCSASGLYHKKPDLRQKNADIQALNEIQYKILKNAVQYVKMNGKLAYFTCSVLRRENEDIVNKVLSEESNLRLTFQKTLLPHVDNTEGFHISCMTRII